LSEETVKELSVMLTEVKLSTERMTAKLEQTCDSIERLEKSIHRIDNAVSSQERRVTILEERVPLNLLQDMALLKESHSTYKRIVWAVIAAIVGTWARNIISLMP
jgi:chromosome segregation ATPase